MALDFAFRLTPPDVKWIFRVAAILCGAVLACFLMVIPAVQLGVYSVAYRFELAKTNHVPESPVDVAPEVFLVRPSTSKKIVSFLALRC